MKKRKYSKTRNNNFILLAIFSITFLFIGLAYANTNQVLNISGTARVGNFLTPSLSLSHTILNMLTDETETIIAYTSATTETVTWTSSNPEFATVDSAGTVTAIASGTTIITATCGNLTASCTVNVSNGQDGPIVFEIIDDQTVNNHIYYSIWHITNNTDKKIMSWSFEAVFPENSVYNSSTFEQLGITLDGNVFSGGELEPGQVLTIVGSMDAPEGYMLEDYLPAKIKNIHVVYEDGTEEDTGGDSGGNTEGDSEDDIDTPEEEIAATGISIDKYYVELNPGDTTTITATVQPSNATGEFVWESDNTSVATVENGVVTALNPGQTTITVSIGNVSATCNVNVSSSEVVLTGITLDKTQVNLNVGDTTNIVATKVPENASGDIVWTSNDSNIASVDQNGNVQAVSVGNTVITASVGNISAQCTVNVTDETSSEVDITAQITSSSHQGYQMWNGTITLTNNSDVEISSFSITLDLPEGTSIRFWDEPGYSVNGNTITGGPLASGAQIQLEGAFDLPNGYTWDDYINKNITVTINSVE